MVFLEGDMGRLDKRMQKWFWLVSGGLVLFLRKCCKNSHWCIYFFGTGNNYRSFPLFRPSTKLAQLGSRIKLILNASCWFTLRWFVFSLQVVCNCVLCTGVCYRFLLCSWSVKLKEALLCWIVLKRFSCIFLLLVLTLKNVNIAIAKDASWIYSIGVALKVLTLAVLTCSSSSHTESWGVFLTREEQKRMGCPVRCADTRTVVQWTV